MEEFTVRHHYKIDLESFLTAEAEILGDVLAKAIETNSILITEEKQA